MESANQVDIVLVEDDDYDAELSLRQLNKHPFVNSAIHFQYAELAFEYLLSTPQLPKIVLIDLGLNGMSGLEFLKKIRSDKRTKNTRAAVISGSTYAKEEVSQYLSDKSYYFEKPLNINKVIHVMCPIEQN